MQRLTLLLFVLCCLSLITAALATEYHVGSGEQYATVNDLLLAVTLADNDIVWVHPGTYPKFSVSAGGGSSRETAAQIRAWDSNNKPVFNAAGEDNCIAYQDLTGALVGKWLLIESLDITGAASRGIYNVACSIIVRNCYIHDNYNGYMGGFHNARDGLRGDAVFEYNEFNRCGSGIYAHPMYMEGYLAEVRYNWLHDSGGGNSYKDRSRNSVLEYNYISAGGLGYRAVQFCGFDDNSVPADTDQYALVIGNIITQNGGGNPWLFIANERSEGGLCQNNGYMTMVNNSCYAENLTGPVIAGDDIAVTTLHNNIFHTNCTRMFDYVEGQSSYGIVNTSYNNWVTSGCTLDPNMVNTVVGTSPGWVNGAWPLGDFHLAAGSPCINAGNNSVGGLPTKEYVQPCSWTTRASDGAIDIGAYEYGGGGGLPPVANFTGNPTSGTAPLTVMFTDTSSNTPTSWSWTFGDGGTSAVQNPSHVYAVGTFTVSLTATNAYGSDSEVKSNYITASAGAGDYFCATAVSESGTIQSGTHTNLHASDDSYLVVLTAKLSGRYGTKMRYTFDTGLGSLSSLSITSESHPSAQPQRQRIYARNFTTGLDVLLDDRNLTSTSDTTTVVNVSSPAPYLSAGQVQVFVRTGDLSGTQWTHSIDFVKITAAP